MVISMVDAHVLRSMIAGFMDEIPEVEGMAVFNGKGELINGYSLRDFDHKIVAKKSIQVAKAAANLSQFLNKGKVAEMSFITQDGVFVIMGRKGLVVTAFTDANGRPQLGLIRHELTVFLDMITKS